MTENLLPMSPAQQGMYFDCQLRQAADYNVALEVLTEPIPDERLVRAVEALMSAQPALRASIAETAAGPAYAVADSIAAPVTCHDENTEELDTAFEGARSAPFQLDEAPLFRTVAATTSEGTRLLVVCHHLIADGQSVSILVEELLRLALGDCEIVDGQLDQGLFVYQESQADEPSRDEQERLKSFWDENLGRHETPRLGHWLDTSQRDDVAREVRLRVPEEVEQAIRRTAQEVGVSEFIIHLAAFGVLLSHYGGTDHVSFSTPFTDRPHWEMDNSIGCFIRTLPVRVDAAPQSTISDLLTEVRSEIMGVWRHLSLPASSRLSGWAGVDPLGITFIHDSYPALPNGVRGVHHPDRVHFPGALTVTVEQLGTATEIVVWFKENALSRERAEQFATRLLAVTQQITENPTALVSSLDPTGAAERAEQMSACRAATCQPWQPTDLGTLFLERTETAPARQSWVDDDRGYTNAWVHDTAVLIQRRLCGVTDDEPGPVAILLPRDVMLPAAVLGTVLAGRAYVPMSEDIPAERVREMVDDAAVSTIVTLSRIELDLPGHVQRIDIDECDELTAMHADDRDEIREQPVEVHRDPQQLLYIEYTSGSTGRPKGVAVTHANVQNTAMDLERRFPLGPDDVFLLKTSFTFDIFGTEIYGWLFGKGVLAILPAGQERDPQALGRAVRRFDVTHLNTSPTMLRVLLTALVACDRVDDLAGLSHVFVGGEALTSDIIDQFYSLELPCTLENVYGPTEATMWASHTRILPEDANDNVPIGRPLNEYRLHVLDGQGRLRGTDLPGEICIAGAGVAVGYLNRDELTARQFITNPLFDPELDPPSMQRMYRTGDIGFLRPDGRFAFLGRDDQQVKVGGVRVELGEIEQAMQRIDGIVEAAALIDESMGEPRVVGFYSAGHEIRPEQVRRELSRTLITQLIPAVLIPVASLPTSAAGKLDRTGLRSLIAAPTDIAPPAETTSPSSSDATAARIAELWHEVLGHPVPDHGRTFFESGGTSLSLMRLQIRMREVLGAEIAITELLSHPTISDQVELLRPAVAVAEPIPTTAERDGDVAIIGIGVQVPGATDVHRFWEVLSSRQETITFHDDEELRALGIDENLLRDPDYVKASGRLQDIDGFDDRLFGLAPAEVELTSPQLRLLYECFWLACEDAGCDPRHLPGRVGVFVAGSDDFEWYRRAVMGGSSFGEAYQGFTLATNHFLSTRLSYHFDLTGPSLTALTGCSSSLTTVHLAIQSLRSGECDIAVAGGVTVELPNGGGYQWVDGMMLSPDGHCRPFDAEAGGTVFANGAALLVLKPLAAAIRDADPIHAVIKGSAIGNDGRRKQSYTAPSEQGQYETISCAYRSADIDPASISFVEAHGTGTLLGDPIEVASLSRVFASAPTGSCLLGSVKGNIGHTDTAAGAVGLAKAALSLEHRLLPGTVNHTTPNPHIDFDATPFVVTAENRRLDASPLRAGINSFGVGGTNVHVILEEPPAREDTVSPGPVLLQFSGATPTALAHNAEKVLRHTAHHQDIRLADVARTLRSRAELPHRGSVVISPDEGRDPKQWLRRLVGSGTAAASSPRVALMFSGQGNQYHRMTHGLLTGAGSQARLFREWLDRIIGLLAPDESDEFRGILFRGADDGRIHRTEWSQYALFSTQYALAKVLESLGVLPDVMIGHSIGELTAATLAGVWDLEDAARLVRRRGQLMQAQQPGVMVAALAPAAEVAPVVADIGDAWISLDNSPQRCVVGMAPQTLDTVLARLDAVGIIGARLQTSHAFHTPMMEAAGAGFAEAVSRVPTRDPRIPIISNRSGRLVRDGEMTDPSYWGDHITGAVRFTEGLVTLLEAKPLVGVETGPGTSLSTFLAQTDSDVPVVSLVRHASADIHDEIHLLEGLGSLWRAGVGLDWEAHPEGRRISLPGYSFDLVPHPVSGAAAPQRSTAGAGTPTVERFSPLEGVEEAFRRVLGHDEVQADDNFFTLGGDSLKATGLTAQLRSLLGVEATVADVFAAPTPATLVERLSIAPGGTAMTKAPEADDHPLSPAQERMYLAARLDPTSLAYNMASVTWIDGHLDHDRVRSALARLVERHEPLRTSFHVTQGQVRQRIGSIPSDRLPLRFTRGEATPGAADAHLGRFMRPFDLHVGPLFRMELLEDDDATLLLFDVHHIVADAVSAEVLARDFGQLFDEDLAPLEFQYTDHVHHAVAGGVQAATPEAEEALLARLENPPAPDVLPLDRPRGQATPAAGRVTWRLDPERTSALLRLAETHQATMSMALLTAWGAVLTRYSGTEDIVIGVPVSARTMAETREMVGMFINMLPIRLAPSGQESFGSALAETREVMLEALAAQEVPFERVVERLGVARVPGRHPLCDISFDFHNIEHHELAIGGLPARQIDTVPVAVGMDLVITGQEIDGAIQLHVDHATDLFDEVTVQDLVGHFDAFLARVCANPDAPLQTISIHSEAEHAQWLARLEGAEFRPLHERIAEQAGCHPDTVAVIDADGSRITYAQLDSWADAVATRLVAAGLERGEPVALVTERTVNLLIAQLAICRAGGAYVPLDPTQPVERHRRILDDIRPRLALAPVGFASTAEIETVLDLAGCRGMTPVVAELPRVSADDPVYVVYTSGSTGRPKGIQVKHRGLSNLFEDHRRREIFQPGDVIISLADPTFDIFAFESLIPLASGATVQLCPSGEQKDAGAVARRIEEHHVTHIQLPVSKMSAFCGSRRFREQLCRLRVIVCGGEHFPENLAELLHGSTTARVFNMYGPTETTVTTTVKELGVGDAVTIGDPIFGSQVLVVGEHGLAQPAGVVGELHVAGQGLAAGYVNRPEETRRAFADLPELPGVPFYRTGDIGVRLSNGEIVLKGRSDHQVKVNGNRIELGEIEQVAMTAPGVGYVVALVEDTDIVCYFTADDEATDAEAAIRAAITAALPTYMMPRHLRQVPEMPRLPNSKIDRSALQTGAPPVVPAVPEPTGTDVLAVITDVWQQVLGRAVQPDDNFFDIGGNSFRLMLVSNRLNDSLDREVPLVELFEHTTPRALAAHLGAAAPGTAITDAPHRISDLGGFEAWEDRPATGARIAVVGVAGVLPGADSVPEHWDNRFAGRVSTRRFDREELLESGIDPEVIDHPDYVAVRGHVAADTFDADLFGYSQAEAEAMDPQLRLLHETAWHTLEDAGYAPGRHHGDVALFVGSGTNFPWVAGLLRRNSDPMAAFEALTRNEKDFLATRVAYKLNLTGPAVTVQTACSTSLVAVHEAVACLRRGEADMALAGGVALNFPRAEGYLWHDGMIFSPDGVCRPFSDDAAGTVAGQGCGMVLLKPLDRALSDGDHIYAVIAGSAVNNDGDAKVGYTAPGVRGQERVIRDALEDAGVDADEIDFIETHGTGTTLGDPIEYQALSQVYGRTSPCALGSVKANIGHLDAAAGIAGLIGAVGVLHHQQVPPMPNFSRLNRAITRTGNIRIPVGKAEPGPIRKAAVSSFGIGGTNAHVILETAPCRAEDGAPIAEAVVLGVSARTQDSRDEMRTRIEQAIAQGAPVRDVAHTLAIGRGVFSSRTAAVAHPGRPLVWLDPGSTALLLDAGDGVRLGLGENFGQDDPVEVEVRDRIDQLLSHFDAPVRQSLESSLTGGHEDRATERVAQFVLRAALLMVLGSRGLSAPTGQDRLLRVAMAHVTAGLGMGDAVAQLRSREVTVPGLPRPDGTTVRIDLITGEALRPLLASLWVRGGDVDLSTLHSGGRRIPLPGYAFERRPMVNDVRLDELFARTVPTRVSVEGTASAEEILRAAWNEVIGSDPTDSDDFLASGGDSLGAVRLCAILKERTGQALTVQDVFAATRFRELALRLGPSGAGTPVVEPVVAESAATTGVFPASAAQRRMYAMCALQEDTTAYNLALGYRVSGRLDVERLRHACRLLVARHDQLRTSFHLDGAQLMMQVHPEVPDVVSHEHVSRDEALARFSAEPRPFDLGLAPLFRVEVLSVDDEEHHLRLDLHHIVGDQASLAVLGRDLTDALADRELSPAPMTYAECMAGLAERNSTESFAEDVDFFRRMIAEAPPRLELPFDHQPPDHPTFAGQRVSVTTGVDKESLSRLAATAGATVYNVVLTALARVLGLHSGQREFLIGTATSGRTVAGSEGTVGMFVNSVPLRLSATSRRSVTEAITATKDHVVEVLSHQNAPFEQILSDSGIAIGGHSHPLFDVFVSFVTTGTEALAIDGVEITPVPRGDLRSRFPLSLSIVEQEGHYDIEAEYRTELFDRTTIETMLRHLDQILIGMVQEPECPFSLVPVESEQERGERRAALTGAGSQVVTALDRPLQDSFARHRDLPAVRWEGNEWSYGEVGRITQQLAGGLQEVGVEPGDVVAVLLERGPWQLWARLALTRLGAVELPLDPRTPAQRITQTLADAGAVAVLTSDPEAFTWPEGVAVHDPARLNGNLNPPQGLVPESPLVLIYTSGTTGRPKGVRVPHGGVLSACRDNGYMDHGPGDRVLYLTRNTFDPSLLDVFSTLLAGACLVMGDHDHNMDVNLLADLITGERVTKGILITAVFHLLMAERPEAIASMSALYVGGEAMQPWAAQRAWEVLGPGKLYNLYGPTEASICSTYFRVDEYPDFERMPIGAPAHNRELFILGPDGTDLPRGVPGELCIAGPGLALGYHDRDELTAERFPESWGQLGRRIYRTGDRVLLDDRYRIVYLDRADRQVKHAGYRIELSEIENVALSHPEVTAAVVLHRSDGGSDSRLLGFHTGHVSPEELRSHLQTLLPAHMIPQQLVAVAEFPLTRHGKVDHARLLAMAEQDTSPAPATTPETSGTDLLALVRSVLGLPNLAPEANLFACGVQSIQAIALTRRLRELGHGIQVSDIYRHPTVAELSRALSGGPRPLDPTVPVVAPAHRLTGERLRQLVADIVADSCGLADAYAADAPSHRFDAGCLAQIHATGAPVGGFMHRVEGIAVDTWLEALTEAVKEHEMLRARGSGTWFDVISPQAVDDLPVLIRVHDLTTLPADQVAEVVDRVATELTRSPFGGGLLWRCAVVRESADSLRVMWTFHHSIFDGSSARLLEEELSARARGHRVRESQRYSDFLAELSIPRDWTDELARFDHTEWIGFAEGLRESLTLSSLPGRISLPLVGPDPLGQALGEIHARLTELTGGTRVGIGLVADCRRWRGVSYASCFGEFLDVVPVTLCGEGDPDAVRERLTEVADSGLHHLHTLTGTERVTGGVLERLQSLYRDGLRFVLVNFQGHIPAGDLPSEDIVAGGLALVQVNIWYDDEQLHLQWVVTPSLATLEVPA